MNFDALTARQRQVVALAARGRLVKEIAGELDIANQTVKNLILASYRKLGLYGYGSRALIAIEHGKGNI